MQGRTVVCDLPTPTRPHTPPTPPSFDHVDKINQILNISDQIQNIAPDPSNAPENILSQKQQPVTVCTTFGPLHMSAEPPPQTGGTIEIASTSGCN